MMQWIQLAVFAIRMAIKYGPKIWTLGNKIYKEVEGKLHQNGAMLSSEESAAAFNHIALAEALDKYRTVPGRPELNRFREDVWKRQNVGKTARKLKDPRLRAKKIKGGTK